MRRGQLIRNRNAVKNSNKRSGVTKVGVTRVRQLMSSPYFFGEKVVTFF